MMSGMETSPPRPLRVGLTGGIGSGKSTVSEYFARLGVPVIDADRIARALVEPGAPGLAQVVAAFGPGILDRAGRLDRARLRRIVFADPDRRRELESILHPLVRREIQERLQACSGSYCIVSIPLLLETGQADLVDRVLVVDSPEELQRSRIAARPGWTAEDADAAIRSQAPREDRLRAADDVIVNDADLPSLQQAVERLHARYLALSAGRPARERPGADG